MHPRLLIVVGTQVCDIRYLRICTLKNSKLILYVIHSDLLGGVQDSPSAWKRRLEQDNSFGPPVVALGKFDALHRGHQKLAIKAVHLGGTPYLISFEGMACILGWEPRLPLVAPMDRTRVLASWKDACSGSVPKEHAIPFSEVRNMSPEDFVSLLVSDLGVEGVVVGSNYRFGYKAAGTARTLKTLGTQYGIKVDIVNLLENSDQISHGLGEVVSSSKIRQALSEGDMKMVEQCLGRRYRLIARVQKKQLMGSTAIKYSDFVNQYPTVGEYEVALSIVCDPNKSVAREVKEYKTKLVFSESGAHLDSIILNNLDVSTIDDDAYCVIQF